MAVGSLLTDINLKFIIYRTWVVITGRNIDQDSYTDNCFWAIIKVKLKQCERQAVTGQNYSKIWTEQVTCILKLVAIITSKYSVFKHTTKRLVNFYFSASDLFPQLTFA